VARDEGEGGTAIRLRVLPAEAQLIERDGVWVIRSRYSHPDDRDADWVDRVREERDASILGEQ
jgi:hypothetical protein